MIKRIRSNRLRFNSDGSSYLEDQYGKNYYEICTGDTPSDTRVNKAIDWQYWSIIGGLIASWLFVFYCLFLKN